MNLSKTDTKELLRTLQDASMIISSLSSNIKEANVARKCRLLRKKLKRKYDRLSSTECRSTADSGFS